jgi:GNAT superfamily N-acetyltransferase
VVPSTEESDRDPTVSDVLATAQRFWSLGGERLDVGDAVLVRHQEALTNPLGTFATALRSTTSRAVAATLARCDDLVDGGCRRVLIDPDTPAAVEAHLAAEDWRLEPQLQLVLPATAGPGSTNLNPRPVRDDADWQRLTELFRLDHLEEDAKAGRRPRPATETLAAVALRRALTPQAEYFTVERTGIPLAFFGVWVDDRIGLIEDVFVRSDARLQGLASDMLRFAVGHVRAAGAGPVTIAAEVRDTPKHLYARLGFQPVAVTRSWLRDL